MRVLPLLATTVAASNCLPKPLSQASQVLALVSILVWLLGVRYTPADRVGLVESLRTRRAAVRKTTTPRTDSRTFNEASTFRSEVLKPGLHLLLWPWRYRIHQVPMVTVPPGTVGYAYSRDEAVRNQDCPDAILQEGTYPIHLAEIFVITRDKIFTAYLPNDDVGALAKHWQRKIDEAGGFANPASFSSQSPRLAFRPIQASDPWRGAQEPSPFASAQAAYSAYSDEASWAFDQAGTQTQFQPVCC